MQLRSGRQLLNAPAVPPYSRGPKVGNPIAILKSHVQGIPLLIVLNQVFNFLVFTIIPKNPKTLNPKP